MSFYLEELSAVSHTLLSKEKLISSRIQINLTSCQRIQGPNTYWHMDLIVVFLVVVRQVVFSFLEFST